MRKAVASRRRTIARLRRLIGACRGSIGRRLPCEGLFDLFDVQLDAVETDLRTSEDLYVVALQSAGDRREERDRAAAALEFRHTPVFRHLARLPRAECRLLTGRVPKTPTPLARQVPHTVEVLRQLALDPPPPVGGVRMDPAVVAADLDTSLRELEAAITALAGADADAKFARQRANQAFTATDRVVPNVARTLESLGQLAGRERITAEVRRCFD